MTPTMTTFCWFKIVKETKRLNTTVSLCIPRLCMCFSHCTLSHLPGSWGTFHMCTVFFFSQRSSSSEDWNHHQRTVFFGDEEQRAWDRCDKSGNVFSGWHFSPIDYTTCHSVTCISDAEVQKANDILYVCMYVIISPHYFFRDSMKPGGWWTSCGRA